MEQLIGLIFIAVLATFAGAELIGKIPPQLPHRSCLVLMQYPA